MSQLHRTLSAVVLGVAFCLSFGATCTDVTITIAHTWDTNSHTHYGLVAAVEAYSAKNPDVTVEIMPGVYEEKFITQALGGAPSDLQFVDGPMVSAHALRGIIQPLDRFIHASEVRKEDFVPPAWEQNVWQGSVGHACDSGS